MEGKVRREFDDYKCPFVGKDTPEIRAIVEKAKEDAIKLAEKFDKEYGD